MKRTGLAAPHSFNACRLASSIPAHAAPPTATSSPGYDARLQEQRAAAGCRNTGGIVKPPSRREEDVRALMLCRHRGSVADRLNHPRSGWLFEEREARLEGRRPGCADLSFDGVPRSQDNRSL